MLFKSPSLWYWVMATLRKLTQTPQRATYSNGQLVSQNKSIQNISFKGNQRSSTDINSYIIVHLKMMTAFGILPWLPIRLSLQQISWGYLGSTKEFCQALSSSLKHIKGKVKTFPTNFICFSSVNVTRIFYQVLNKTRVICYLVLYWKWELIFSIKNFLVHKIFIIIFNKFQA